MVISLRKVILFILVILFTLPIVAYVSSFHGELSAEHERWSQFGSYLSGVYGTLAFLILAYTTNMTRRQFKAQNDDNVFFKLHESHQNRIFNSSIEVSGKEYRSYEVVKYVANKFYDELSMESVKLARKLLVTDYRTIDNVHYMKILQSKYGNDAISSFDKYKQDFIKHLEQCTDDNSRHEVLKTLIGPVDHEGEDVKDALRATGSVNFYKIDFKQRQNYYRCVEERLLDEFGEFLDGYYRNVRFMIKFSENSVNKETYREIIRSQLNKYELIILFYMVVSKHGTHEDRVLIYSSGIFSGLLSLGCQVLMIDFPSDEIINGELKHAVES